VLGMANFCAFLRFSCTCYFVSLFLVVGASVIDCLERLASEMTNCVLSWT